MGWQHVSLKERGWTALQSALTRKGSFPDVDFGSRCLCCDQETETRTGFDPSARHVATGIKLPACDECRPHIARGNNYATVQIVLLCVALLCFGLAYRNGWGFAVVGAIAVLFMGLYALSVLTTRASMAKQGHRNGLEVVALPGALVVRSTNPRFVKEIRERNPALCEAPALLD